MSPEQAALLQDPELKSYKLVNWGRHGRATTLDATYATLVMLFCPTLVIACYVSINHFDGSISEFCKALLTNPIDITVSARSLLEGLGIYLAWQFFQLCLYQFLPGKIAHGQITPAGHLLEYKVNGLLAWFVSNLLFLLGGFFGLWKLSIVADYWGSLLIWANVYGYLLTMFAYLKAQLYPTHPDDCKFSGSILYDIYMGVELNPRIGKFDFKLFHNGRPGIVAWSIINISFTALQFEKFARVTPGTIVANILAGIYIVDFFYNEDWYLRTIDIAHDHFGFYLAWGDSVWLPSMYTLQTQFLSVRPDSLPLWVCSLLLIAGMAGYVLLRLANHSKDFVRKTRGLEKLWGRIPLVIRTEYSSGDGEVHSSLLLVSGLWGLSRHINYVGDLILSLSACLACGSTYLIPYTYIIFMTILLIHRTIRDNARCSEKYGAYWTEYTERVRWTLIPWIW